jgi:hypothetical protein
VPWLAPRDVEGGTWVGVNKFGNAFGLLNWHAAPAEGPYPLKSRSRGLVIPHAASYRLLGQLELSWTPTLFAGMLPFRLVGVFPEERRLMEWRWNTREIEAQSYDWAPRHWFSSGLSDEQAAARRGEVCAEAWLAADAGSADWLRRLHRSHAGGPGPFSLCVHREDVGTLSYTEIEFRAGQARMVYIPGRPCTATHGVESTL